MWGFNTILSALNEFPLLKNVIKIVSYTLDIEDKLTNLHKIPL